MSRWKPVLALVLLSVVVSPQVSEAGLGEVIWGLSGPQMLGVGFGCRVSGATNFQRRCQIGSPPAATEEIKSLAAAKAQEQKVNPFGFSLGGSYFFSTGKGPYGWGDVEMLAFEPGVSVTIWGGQEWRFYHAVGISRQLFFGQHFQAFDKFAVKFTLAEAVYKRVSFGVNVRRYQHRVTHDDFGIGDPSDSARSVEWAWGSTFAYIFKK